jgi:hypothetical protein
MGTSRALKASARSAGRPQLSDRGTGDPQNDNGAPRAPLRRGDALPRSVQLEIDRRDQYPRKAAVRLGDAPLELRWRKTRLQALPWGDECVRRRETFCWVYIDSRRAGAVHFIEWYPDPFIGDDLFFDEIDADSHEAASLAEAVLSGWAIDDLAEAGSILEFRLAWMTPEYARGSLWAEVATHFLKAQFRKDAGVLMLKAFPLEYEGRADGSAIDDALTRRRAAMIRHYRRVLGVELLPGWAGEDGWMWRRLSPTTPAPAERRWASNP